MANYKRVLLKVSGEALMGDGSFGIDVAVLSKVANEIQKIRQLGVELAIVVGGGNIVRGLHFAKSKDDRVSCDHMGMLSTVINALALRNALLSINIKAEVLSAVSMPSVCKSFNQSEAVNLLERGDVLIFAAGTGNPYFTTDTAATLRALEIKADLLVKATQVNGVYDSDPKQNPTAKHLPRVSYDEVMQKNLAVMDMTSIALAKENNLPLIVCSMSQTHGVYNALLGEGSFSLVS